MQFPIVTLASLASLLLGAALVAPATSEDTSADPTAVDEAPGPRGSRTGTSCFPQANKIKLQSVTGKPLQVFEVEVWELGSNVALGKTATQGSTFKDKAMFAASNAVDGDNTTFSHTKANDCGWLEIDLEGSHDIESIKIWNRYCGSDSSDPKGCLCRLSHATVSLLDDAGNWIDGGWLGDTCGMLEVENAFTSQCPPSTSPTDSPVSAPGGCEGYSSTLADPSDFTFVANGRCGKTGSWSTSYHATYYVNNATIGATLTGCASWCLTAPHAEFVGVTVSSVGWCRCEYSGGLPTGISSSDYCPDASGSADSDIIGLPDTADGATYAQCYSYDLYTP